jgi:predicted nuclease of predicted toxin-antitoxin system
MRFLANESFPLESVRRLRDAQHDVFSVGESMPGIKDEQVLSLAARESRVLLAFDRDYEELIYLRGMAAPLGVVYLRFIPLTRHILQRSSLGSNRWKVCGSRIATP